MEINKILQEVFDQFTSDKDSSDLHLRTGDYPIIRTKNRLLRMEEYELLTPQLANEFIETLFKIKYGEEDGIKQFEKFLVSSEEVDMAIMIPGSDFRARVNIFKSLGKSGAVLRKIPNDMPLLETLGFYKDQLDKIKEYVKRKEGLILVTGQTGSGKSTTLAAIIDYVNKHMEKHIITIEDPVEFIHKSQKSVITHREVGENSDTESFYKGLKMALREDPDIILVGEIRDEITALAAIQAAQTGHIVFATLHTNSAPETILRIIDMFPPERTRSIKVSLAASLRMIISQKLAPTVSNKRVLLYELLISNTQIQNLIVKDDFNEVQVASAMNSARLTDDKMLPLEQCIIKRVLEQDPDRQITPETAYEFANDKSSIKEELKKKLGEDGFKRAINQDDSSGFFD